MASFEISIEKVLKHEGGYDFIQGDAGGETNFGISKKSYPNEDIKNLTRARAVEIYRRDFWEKIYGDKISNQLTADSIFDASVNMGVSRAVKIAQSAAGVISDGIIGKETLLAINLQDPKNYLPKFSLEKIRFYASLCNKDRENSKFLLGWINRSLES